MLDNAVTEDLFVKYVSKSKVLKERLAYVSSNEGQYQLAAFLMAVNHNKMDDEILKDPECFLS